ncbi:nucleotidyltransferase domain-containing protein [Candidatus Entotheonella palauensis]|uniref:nucleotidyltransferase domain-containing protein n=1 Tax=Candidatus Entotheonella palauensis TaxID=93172 RepID=UPI000B7CF928|nr:nucleotidyltransferase family protein [Candidatus Entotheonella palauensis]
MDTTSQLRIKAILANDINWDYLIEIALYHKMLPLLCQTLSNICDESIPASVMSQLHEMATHIAMRNMALAQELLRLLELLQNHNIDALTFKGPALTSLLYGNLIFRFFGDLDILVHPQDLLRARELLLDHGYQLPLASENQPSETEILQYGHALHVEHETSHALVDLHWRLGGSFSPLPLTFEELWQQHQSMPLLGASVKTFQTEDLLIYLCVHGAKHFWYKLGWICDIATLVRSQPSLLNDAFMARVKACGAERMVLLGLLAAKQYFGAPLPEVIWLRAKSDSTVVFLLEEVNQRLLTPSPDTHEHIGPRLYRRYLQLRMRERFRDQASLWLAIISSILRPTKRDREVLRLPSWASCLYYLVRPVHCIQRYGWRFLQNL